MIVIDEIAGMIRKYATHGLKPILDEDSRRPAEILDKENDVKLLAEPSRILRRIDEIPVEKSYFNLYALDSSSRVLDTPYVFIAIATGTLISRFTGKTIDCPPISLIQGGSRESCRFLAIIPNFEPGVDFDEKLSNYLFTKNMVGESYDHAYNRNILLEEIRLLVESYLAFQGTWKDLLDDSVILVDGPLIYPSSLELPTINQSSRINLYKSSLEAINNERVSIWKRLQERRSQVIGVVKRLYKSYYLSACDPFEIGVSSLNDEAYLSTVSRRFSVEEGLKPFVLGPLKIDSKVRGTKVERLAWYIGIPRRSFSSQTPLTNYAHYRVEVLADNVSDENVLSPIIYDSIFTGALLPLSIIIADYRAKKLSSIVSRYLAFSMGLGEANIYQYSTI